MTERGEIKSHGWKLEQHGSKYSETEGWVVKKCQWLQGDTSYFRHFCCREQYELYALVWGQRCGYLWIVVKEYDLGPNRICKITTSSMHQRKRSLLRNLWLSLNNAWIYFWNHRTLLRKLYLESSLCSCPCHCSINVYASNMLTCKQSLRLKSSPTVIWAVQIL